MKKIVSLALSTAMAFSMFASVTSAATLTTQEKYNALVTQGIFAGYPNGEAYLDKDMTRAEFAKVVALLTGLDTAATTTSTYADQNYANAWYKPYVEAVTKAGYMQGTTSGSKKMFNPSGKVTVQEMAATLVRAAKLEIPTTGIDNGAAAWAKGEVQAAINAGLFSKDLNFPGVANRGLLVDTAYTYQTALSKPAVASYEVTDNGATVIFTLANAEKVTVKPEKALVANTATTVTFKYNNFDYSESVTWKLTTATKVESAQATNLKQVVVTFDGTVDPASAEQVAQYSIVRNVTGATANAIDKAVVSADSKSVVLTLTGSLMNNTDYKVSVSGIKTGGAVVSTKDVAFKAMDTVAPTVEKVESLGNTAIKVTFSEPVNITSSSAASTYFTLDGKVVSGTLNVNDNVVTIKSFTTIANGAHTLVTKKAITDFNGYPVIEKSFDFQVAEDKTAPTVTQVAGATFESATVVFSEDVDPSTISGSNVYWMDGSQKRYANSGFEKQIDSKTFKFAFSGLNKLPSYATDLYVTGVKDYSGNQIAADTKVTVSAVIDQVRPEVASFTFSTADNKSAVLKFTKALDTTTFQAKNVVIKDKDGKVVSNIYTANFTEANKTLTINFANALSAGTYSLEVTGLKDSTTLANTMLPYSTQIVVNDLAQPSVVSTVQNGTSIIINFDKKMNLDGEGSILNPANYYATYTVDGVNTLTGQLPSGTTYETLADQKSVLIKVPANVNVTKLAVQGVKSAAGNVLTGYVKEVIPAGSLVTTFAATATKAISTTEIVVKMNQPAAAVVPGSFSVTETGTPLTVSSASVDASDNTLVHLKLSSTTPLKTVTSTYAVTASASSSSVAVSGATLVASAPLAVKDAVAPTIVKNTDGKIVIAAAVASANDPTKGIVVDRANDTIFVNFSENIYVPAGGDAAFGAGNLSITKANGDKLVYGTDYTVSVGGRTAEISLVAGGTNVAGYNGIYRVALNNDNKYLTDAVYTDFDGSAKQNAAENFDVATDAVDPNAIVLDYAAPTATVGSTNTATALTLNVSEQAVVTTANLSTNVTAATVTPAGPTTTIAPSIAITTTAPAANGDKFDITLTDVSGNAKTYTATFNGTAWVLA